MNFCMCAYRSLFLSLSLSLSLSLGEAEEEEEERKKSCKRAYASFAFSSAADTRLLSTNYVLSAFFFQAGIPKLVGICTCANKAVGSYLS
jgi:hypothetical protein